jgi:hypothetical protein
MEKLPLKLLLFFCFPVSLLEFSECRHERLGHIAPPVFTEIAFLIR